MSQDCNHCKVRAATNGWLCHQCQWEHAKYLEQTLSGQAQLPEHKGGKITDDLLAPTFLRSEHDDSEAAALQGRDYWQRLPRWCRKRLPHRWHFEQAKQHKPTDL